MSDWTSGYVADIDYVYGYHNELNPLRIQLALLHAGIRPPDVTNGAMCELGFGQGVSLNMHSAGQSARYCWGTDFNPSQASFAQGLERECGSGARLFDQPFDEFCARADLPDFDFISLHGIWSWISDENKKVIVDFVRRRLKVGGVVYVSYNTLPGLSAMVPLRRLMVQHADVMGSRGQGAVGRVDSAIAFVDALFATDPGFVQRNPDISNRFEQIKKHDRHYLAHEYFNRDWTPMTFADMAGWLEPAKLSYACSAHYLDHVNVVNLTPAQIEFMKSVPDAGMQESVRDMMVNQQFRRDYWIKGAVRMTDAEKTEALRSVRVVLVEPRNDVSLKMDARVGEVILQESIYAPILDLLSDYRPRTLAEIEVAINLPEQGIKHVIQAVMMLAGLKCLQPAVRDDVSTRAKPYTDKLNATLLECTRFSRGLTFLASPVTGGGIAVPRVTQFFVMAYANGRRDVQDTAGFAFERLMALGERVMKDGKAIEKREDNFTEILVRAEVFHTTTLPLLQRLGIV